MGYALTGIFEFEQGPPELVELYRGTEERCNQIEALLWRKAELGLRGIRYDGPPRDGEPITVNTIVQRIEEQADGSD